VDCVKLGTCGRVFNGWKPQLVISGINSGSNPGMVSLYSGTVSCAREAALLGIVDFVDFSFSYIITLASNCV